MDGVEAMLSPGKHIMPEHCSPGTAQLHPGTALKNAQLRDHDDNPIRVEEKVAWMSNKGHQAEGDIPDSASTVRGSFAGMLRSFIRS